jgi:hypothetical protein
MMSINWAVESRIQDPLSGFRIEATSDLRRAFEVGEEHRDLLTLAFEGGFGCQDFLDEVAWCVFLG